MKHIQSIIRLTLSMAIFGSIGFFTIHTGIPALELVFIRCICATIILGLLWLVTKTYKSEQFTFPNIRLTIICGIFLVLNWVFLFKAFEEMAISIAISIYNLAPIFVLMIAAFIFKEKISLMGTIATTICFIGTLFIIGTNSLQSLDAFTSSGVIWALLSAICYALTMMTSRKISNISSYALTFIQTTVGIIILLPFCDFMVFHDLTTSNWLYIIGTGVIHTGFVYYLFFDSVRTLPAILVSVLVFVDPLVAILLDVVLLSFSPTLWQIVGMILIFGSIVATIFIPTKKQETSN